MERSNNKSGFTLIEMLAVMILISITAGVGIANYRAFQTQKTIETELLKFHKAVEYASQLSRTENSKICSSQAIDVKPTVYKLELYAINGQYNAYRITGQCDESSVNPINYNLEKGIFTQRPFNTITFEVKTGKIIENIENACYKIQYNGITKSLVFKNKYGGAEIKSENCN
ncbi:MAG: hypothetical protein KatS3mg090_0916 [Patescibacteria group bacterium]|nr:MAG: hypothetical protein KatS3mg090_0916 [Patescibacteria group bacterium]